MSPRGYSLVELVFTLALVGFVVAVGQPLLSSSLGEAALSAAVEETVAALQFAQSSAVGEGQSHRVTVNKTLDTLILTRTSPDSVGVESLSDELVSEIDEVRVKTLEYVAVAHPLRRGHDYVVDLTDARFRGVSIATVDFGSKAQITFDDRGEPSRGGSIRIALGGRGVLLTVDEVTGRVSRASVSILEEPILE